MDCSCKTCSHSVFDEIWGEYKCTVYCHRIYEPEKMVTCERYEKDSSKKNETKFYKSRNRHSTVGN